MATIGPSIHDVDMLSQLLEAGMVAARVDLTWGPLEFHRNSLKFLEVRRQKEVACEWALKKAAWPRRRRIGLHACVPTRHRVEGNQAAMRTQHSVPSPLARAQEAMKRTRRLCACSIDTMGRELMIRGQWQVNDQGYPWVLGRNDVEAGQTIVITTREDAVADAK
jgi:hypothetical protein